MEQLILLASLFVVAFIQNAAFTAVSRSRNSGDVWHHAKWSLASNGVWFITQILVFSSIIRSIEQGTYWLIAISCVVYVLSTTAGSCWMMARMLKTETGKRRVGAR